MILYHGSKIIVDKPLFRHGKRENDYGEGFYCTEDIELAREWACQNPAGGFVNCYEIDEDNLKIFEFDSKDIVIWLAVLLSNRKVRYSNPIEKKIGDYLIENLAIDLSKYDMIKGYRADDSYFAFVRSFLANTITIEQLGKAMELEELGWQICLKSRKSFELIRYAGCEPINGDEYYPKWIKRDSTAREGYYKLLESDVKSGIYARDILDKEMTADELRIQ
ncbi:MAG: DUF3990 domain-containing protein [Lachnospiraceae bacterium]|nr:DUF3990 domain-containing protein [Lachnospiraceae bacterium]